MNNMAIGVFDSGVGGLSCVRELLNCLPNEDITYLGDTLRMPYGLKTVDELYKLTKDDINFLNRRKVKLIAAACGTISSNVSKEKLDNLNVPFVDVINPTVNAALNKSTTKRIGIIATPATIKSDCMGKRIKSLDNRANIISIACPDFVTLIESGHISDNLIKETAKEYLSEIIDFNVDTLILGCTHFPIISKVIGEIMGDNVTLIDSGKETALEIKRVLEKLDLLTTNTSTGKTEYFVTSNTESFDNVAKIFLGGSANVKSILMDIKE